MNFVFTHGFGKIYTIDFWGKINMYTFKDTRKKKVRVLN